jgi:hypothetical protein
MSWKKIGISKELGGLDFRDYVMFNKALLANTILENYAKSRFFGSNDHEGQILLTEYHFFFF